MKAKEAIALCGMLSGSRPPLSVRRCVAAHAQQQHAAAYCNCRDLGPGFIPLRDSFHACIPMGGFRLSVAALVQLIISIFHVAAPLYISLYVRLSPMRTEEQPRVYPG